METVKIVDEKNERLGFRIINKEDFNEKEHEIFDEELDGPIVEEKKKDKKKK